jgi:hypothetical protein
MTFKNFVKKILLGGRIHHELGTEEEEYIMSQEWRSLFYTRPMELPG